MSRKLGVVVDSTHGSHAGWLGTARSLGRKGIHVIRLSPRDWYSSKYCSTIISPNMTTEPREFLRFLVRLGRTLIRKDGHKNVLLPSSDNALILISKNKDILKDCFEPVAPDWVATEKVIDKSETYNIARALGIPVPETFVLNNANEISWIAKTVYYPCLIKPTYSHIFLAEFGTKMFEVNSRNMLIKTCKALLVQGYKMLIQEKIPGKDDQIYTLETCFDEKSQPLAIFTSRKLRQYPPHYGVGSSRESVWEPRIVDRGISLLKKIRFYGIAEVEFKKDPRTGDFVLLEINGRIPNQSYLATVCGVNIPYILYKDLTGEKQKPLYDHSCQFELGVKWVHLTIDFLSMMKEGETTWANWLRPILIGKKTFAILSLGDLHPFLSSCLRISELKHTLRHLMHAQG